MTLPFLRIEGVARRHKVCLRAQSLHLKRQKTCSNGLWTVDRNFKLNLA